MKSIVIAIVVALVIVGAIFGWLYKSSADYGAELEAARKQAALQDERR